MELRASFTVENSVTIPIFIMIFMCLVALTGYYHDKIIVKGAVEMSALKLEQMDLEQIEVDLQTMEDNLKEYIESKTLFMKKINVTVEETNHTYKVTCCSQYVFSLMKKVTGLLRTSAEVKENSPSNIIRITEAAMEVMGK